MKFTKSDIEHIAAALDAKMKVMGEDYRLSMVNDKQERKVSLEIYPDKQLGDEKGNLIIVYANNAFMQLQFCSGYVISNMLGEVTFIAENKGKISGLIVEKEAGCSLYANVDASVLSGDFTKLGPEVMMSSIALSLSEQLINEGEERINIDTLDAEDD